MAEKKAATKSVVRPVTMHRGADDERAAWMAECRRMRKAVVLANWMTALGVLDTLILFGKGRVRRVKAKGGGL